MVPARAHLLLLLSAALLSTPVASTLAASTLAATAGSAGPRAAPALPPGSEEEAAEVEEFTILLDEMDAEDARAVFGISKKLADAESASGFKALRDKWKTIESPAARQQMMTSFYAKRLPSEFDETATKDRLNKRLIDVLDLGARDTSATVQASALRFLKKVALQDFAENYDAYYPWFEGQYGKDATEIVARSITQWVKTAGETKGEEVRALADFIEENGELMRDLGAGRRAADRAGYLDVLGSWLDGGEAETQTAMRLLSGQRLRRADLEKLVLPRAKVARNFATRTWAIAALGDSKAGWAIDDLHAIFTTSFDKPDEIRPLMAAMCRTLASIGDARSIPILIATMEAEGTAAGTHTITMNGLAPLTGVKVKDGQDAAWWRAWWEKNRSRFPENVRALEVPVIAKAPSADPAAAKVEVDTGADVLTVASADVRGGFDNDKRYFLIGNSKENTAPAEGFKLLVIIPGGDGGADFNLFARRVWKSGLNAGDAAAAPASDSGTWQPGTGWIVAQMVAPKWDENQSERLVWPLDKVPYRGEVKKSKFSTEDFADAVVSDVKSRVDIDPRHIYLLGWSSGGPACYSLMLREKTPFAGAIIAMSTFKPEHTEGLQNAALPRAGATKEGAATRRFYILHSEQDTTVPFRWASEAYDALRKSKAQTTLQRYEGGHGWKDDALASIRSGVQWLMSDGNK